MEYDGINRFRNNTGKIHRFPRFLLNSSGTHSVRINDGTLLVSIVLYYSLLKVSLVSLCQHIVSFIMFLYIYIYIFSHLNFPLVTSGG